MTLHMREKISIGLVAIAGMLLIWNLYTIFLVLPDEKLQGGVYRILFFHFPSAAVAGTAALGSLVASALYLIRRDMRFDAAAVAITEMAVLFGAVVIVTGSIWARLIWGVWWAWDARGTSILVTILMYTGYLMLREAIDEPAQRARSAAVLSILTFPGVYITYKSIEWWRTQHPQPVFKARGGGGFDPAMFDALLWNWIALTLIAIVLAAVRTRQENAMREIDGLRRLAHSI